MIALCGALIALVLVPTAGALAAGTQVQVRVEGKSSTLLAGTSVQTHSGSIRTGGTPAGTCPATSAAGALDVATHHRWSGKYYASVPGIFVTSIFGEKPTGSLYWTVFVDNRSSTLGICSLKLHRREQLLFAVTNGRDEPIVLSAPQHATRSHSFQVKAFYYDARGKAKALAGLRIRGAGATTNKQGIATVSATRTGKLTLTASKSGYIRSAPVTVRVTS